VRYIRKKANPRVRERNDKGAVAFWDMYLNHPSNKDLDHSNNSFQRSQRTDLRAD
jgi:hypothetical protein